MLNLSPEAELLFYCSRSTAQNPEKIKTILQKGVDFDALLRMAIQNGTMPLLHLQLARMENGYLPTSFTAALQDLFMKNAGHNLFLTGELFKILDLFSENGISAIPFKGPATTQYVFGDLSYRRFGDLDVLVHKRDVLRAKQLLLEQGFQSVMRLTASQETSFLRFQHAYDFLRDNVRVEIHWRIAPSAFVFPLDTESLWDRLVPVNMGQRIVLTLCAEDLLLILCVNGAIELWERLVRICDIAELIQAHSDLNWNTVLSRANATGSKRILFVGLFLAVRLLEAKVPEQMWQRVLADGEVRPITERAIRALLDSSDAQPALLEDSQFRPLYWKMRERFWHRARYLVQVFFTPHVQDWDLFDFPRRLSFLYYVVRPFRLALKFGRRMIRQ